MASETRHDPFSEEDFLGEVAAFQPKTDEEAKIRPRAEEVEKIAQARGFADRRAVSRPVKEPLKPLQFRRF